MTRDGDDRPCSVADCDNFHHPGGLECKICRLYFCQKHREPHSCYESAPDDRKLIAAQAQTREFKDLLARVESVDLKGIAEGQRPGHTCVVHTPKIYDETSMKAGGYNIHLLIEFDDGVKWLARIRQEAFFLPRFEMGRMMMESAVTTQHYLKEQGLSVPDAWPLGTELKNLNICFIEYLDGIDCDQRILNIDEQSLRFIEGYARFSISSSHFEFPAIGSLFPGDRPGDLMVGPFINRDVCISQAPYFLGPFSTMAERYIAHVDLTLRRIVEGKAGVSRPVSMYLQHLELREMIRKDVNLSQKVDKTYIKHGDSSGGNMKRDENGNLVAILDWDWAHATDKGEAFAGPLAFLDDSRFFKTDLFLSPSEDALARAYDRLGRSDLGGCVRNGKKYHQLLFCVGFSTSYRFFRGLRKSFHADSLKAKTEEEWMAGAQARFGEDEGLKALRRLVGSR